MTTKWPSSWGKTRSDHGARHSRHYRAPSNRTLRTEFAYNGAGARTSRTVGGDTTEYVLDLLATLPVVISDTGAIYLYGLDIIAQQQAERLYYVHDGLGSVRQLVDTTGQIETNYAYDPFGVPAMGGEVYNPYQYTGEAWDAEVGLLYLRARYYQPEMGRFITKDPWEGDTQRPGTLNHYTYVVNRPVGWVDPGGLQYMGPDYLPQPSGVPTPDAQASATPTGQDIDRAVVDQLSSVYGMYLGHLSRAHQYHYLLGYHWTTWQLDLVRQAAAEFASRVEGGPPGLRARIAPVFLYKTEGQLLLAGEPQRAYALVGNIVAFAGDQGFWEDMPGQKWTAVHELAHVWDIKSGFRFSRGMIERRMWTFTEAGECQVPLRPVKKPYVSVWKWREDKRMDYLNPREDWAEAVAAYVYKDYAGTQYWEISESRWYFVAREMNPGNPERHSYPEEWRGLPFVEAPVASGQ